MAGATDPAIAAVEAWFVERGVPHFAADSAPTRAVLRRAAPVLVAYLAVTLLMTASFAWSFEVNLLAVAVAVIVVGIAWALVNVLRGRHWRSLPRRFGPLEVAAFLLIPALPPLIVGFQLSDAVLTIIESAAFLAAVYVATSFGVVGAVRWAFGRARAQVGSIGRLLTRALPLLMVFIAFAFLQSDTWQVMAALDWPTVALVLVLFFGLSVAFLVGRLVPEIKRLASIDRPWSEVLEIARRTVARPLCEPVYDVQPVDAPLTAREWVNVGTLILFSQGLQIALVTLAVQIALIVFGLLLVPLPIQQQWSAEPVDAMAMITVGDLTISLTEPLIAVSLILGAFSGLYFTIAALSDAAYRAEFFSDADRELDDVFAVRAVYHATLRQAATVPATATVAGDGFEYQGEIPR
jgi:hypothetical protein